MKKSGEYLPSENGGDNIIDNGDDGDDGGDNQCWWPSSSSRASDAKLQRSGGELPEAQEMHLFKLYEYSLYKYKYNNKDIGISCRCSYTA